MKKVVRFLGAALALIVAIGLAIPLQGVLGASPDYTVWNDLGIIYTAPSGAAYYPSVIYDANGFGTGSPLYKMWYSNGSGGIYLVTSPNGLAWGSPVLANSGLPAGSAHHAQVLYDPNCFGLVVPCTVTDVKYRIWYWDMTADLYSINAIATAQSVDGMTWINNGPITQSGSPQLVTGAGVGWNRGSYGPIHLIYQPGASNSGPDLGNYRYVMYYDGQDGEHEVTGLATSTNGSNWVAYSASPVLDHGASGWDSDDSAYGTVLHLNGGWQYWYSGGSCAYDVSCPISEGIGYAASPDGKSWTKAGTNPIFHITQGVSYRNKRVYTPSVVDDGSGSLKMYYTAVGTDNIKKIGLAILTPAAVFVNHSWTGFVLGTPVLFPADPTTHTIGIDAFDTIQKGIDAVLSGGTVTVASGTYPENIAIPKPLTLQSASGAGSTFIDATITGNPYVVFISSKNVTLDGFDISSPGYTGAADASGVVVEPTPYAAGAGVRITNNIIHDIGTPTRISVAYGNVGINLGMVDGVEIDHNQIFNILHNDPLAWANGISIWGGDPTTPSDHITIHDNSFRDIASPYPFDAAISTQTDVGMNVLAFGNSLVSTAGHPTEFGVQVLSTNVVDARHNWWGDPTGPSGAAAGHGSGVTVNVLYDPWWTTSTGTVETPALRAGTSIGSLGGEVTNEPWSAILPAGAVPDGSYVDIQNLGSLTVSLGKNLKQMNHPASIAVQGPSGPITAFSTPIQVCYHYSDADLALVKNNPLGLVIGTAPSGTSNWSQLVTQANQTTRRVCASVSHLSNFEMFVNNLLIPVTGFAPDRVTVLPEQTINYADLGDLWLEIPRLGVRIPIVGVPQTADGWDVSWLGNQAGWLNGTAFPTWAGNSVLTAHVFDAYGRPGPFVSLNQLWYGDRVIVHGWGQQYIYEVREVMQVAPETLSAMLKHEENPWLTLVTCRGYDPASDSYRYRVLVRAVQVAIK